MKILSEIDEGKTLLHLSIQVKNGYITEQESKDFLNITQHEISIFEKYDAIRNEQLNDE